VSFKVKEAKRQKRAAGRKRKAAIARNVARRSEGSYFLTLVRRTTCCARCAGRLTKGREMIFRKTPQESLCIPCADRGGISYRPSTSWEESRRVKVRQGPAWMRDSERAA
jgi:hypothetical protein